MRGAIKASCGLCYLLAPLAQAVFPYTPSRAFSASTNSSHLAYFFLPKPSSSTAFQLLALEATASFDDTHIPYQTLSSSLPFLPDDTDASTAFTPIIDSAGNLRVYVGKCSSGPADASLWSFTPDGAAGNWTQHQISGSNGDSAILSGANHLASGVSFSPSVDVASSTKCKTYIFGGMCPDSKAVTDSWTSSAHYSNSLMVLAPGSSPQSDYTTGISKARGLPVAEAGFTITPLLSSTLQTSSGVIGKQQNYILLGGHTETAFINTSQVAMLSLPEESWTFVPITTTEQRGTELTVRARAVDVEPRSGHSAVLSADGKQIIVFGGWVGDMQTPAEPQLAILEVGDGYGGSGDWRWKVPVQRGDGVPSGHGIYGHAAVVLPGDVMMIVGGYSLSSVGSRSKRAAQVSNSNSYFFNTSSNTWSSRYTTPEDPTHSLWHKGSRPSNLDRSRRVGLGAGLSIGLLTLVILLLSAFCYVRHSRRHRGELPEKSLREHSLTAQRFSSSSGLDYTCGGIDGRGGEESAGDYIGNQPRGHGHSHSRTLSDHLSVDHSLAEAERTGLLVGVASPTRGLRRGLHSRPRSVDRLHCCPPPGFDGDSRRSLAGSIHRIDERAEYEVPCSEGTTAADATRTPHTATSLDPFGDPHSQKPLSSHPILTPAVPTASPARERELEIQAWVSDWAAAEALIHRSHSAHGTTSNAHRAPRRSTSTSNSTSTSTSASMSPDRRSSPDRVLIAAPKHSHERSGSTLSNDSIPSTVSALSLGPLSLSTLSTLSQSISHRSVVAAASAFFTTPSVPPTNPLPATHAFASSPTFTTLPGIIPRATRTRSTTQSTTDPRPSTGTASFQTARSTSFHQLQAEGELLLPRPSPVVVVGTLSADHGPTIRGASACRHASSSTAGGARARARGRGWLGSVRRALPLFATVGATGSAVGYAGEVAERSGSSSSDGACPAPSVPIRRSGGRGAAGGECWKGKKGRRDWESDGIVHVDGDGDRDGSLARLEMSGGVGVGVGRLGSMEGGSVRSYGSLVPGEDEAGDEDEEWDVEAAVERRVVQVMFTVPRERLRVVNGEDDQGGQMHGDVGEAGEGKGKDVVRD